MLPSVPMGEAACGSGCRTWPRQKRSPSRTCRAGAALFMCCDVRVSKAEGSQPAGATAAAGPACSSVGSSKRRRASPSAGSRLLPALQATTAGRTHAESSMCTCAREEGPACCSHAAWTTHVHKPQYLFGLGAASLHECPRQCGTAASPPSYTAISGPSTRPGPCPPTPPRRPCHVPPPALAQSRRARTQAQPAGRAGRRKC